MRPLRQRMIQDLQLRGCSDRTVEAYVRDHPEDQGKLFHGLVEAAKARGEFPIPRDKIGIYRTPERGVALAPVAGTGSGAGALGTLWWRF